MNNLKHVRGGACPHCGYHLIVSTWLLNDIYYYVLTCVVCDGQIPEEDAE